MSSILDEILEGNLDGLVVQNKVGFGHKSNLGTASLGKFGAGIALLEHEVSTFELLALAGKENVPFKLLLDRLGEFDHLLLFKFFEGEFINDGLPIDHRLHPRNGLVIDADNGRTAVSVVEGFAHDLAIYADLGGEAQGLLGHRGEVLEVFESDVHRFIGLDFLLCR